MHKIKIKKYAVSIAWALPKEKNKEVKTLEIKNQKREIIQNKKNRKHNEKFIWKNGHEHVQVKVK